MSFLEDTPLLATGSKEVDGFCTISFLLLLGATVVGVVAYFRQTQSLYDRNAVAKKKKGDRLSNARKRQVALFLLMAVVSVVLVNRLRFEHRRLKARRGTRSIGGRCWANRCRMRESLRY